MLLVNEDSIADLIENLRSHKNEIYDENSPSLDQEVYFLFPEKL
jgi:hypothetical protein